MTHSLMQPYNQASISIIESQLHLYYMYVYILLNYSFIAHDYRFWIIYRMGIGGNIGMRY